MRNKKRPSIKLTVAEWRTVFVETVTAVIAMLVIRAIDWLAGEIIRFVNYLICM